MAKATQNKAPKNVTKDGADKGKVTKTNANLTREERRARDNALKEKAKKETLASGFHFDDTIPASQFFQNYGSAVKKATLGPLHAKANEEPAEQTDAEKRLEVAGTDDMHVDDALVAESDAKDAEKELTSAQKTIAAKKKFDEEMAAAAAKEKFEQTVETAKTEDAANENTVDEKPTTLAIKPTEIGAELVPAVTDPWLKREDETKAEWKARKKLLAKAAAEAAAAKPVEQQAPNVMANPLAAPEALVKAMHTETRNETRNGEPPTVADSAAKPPKGERYLTQEELDWWTARGGVVPGFVPVNWTIAKHEEHIATVDAMKNKTDETKAADEPANDAPVEQPAEEAATTTDTPADDATGTPTPATDEPAPVDQQQEPTEQTPPVVEPTVVKPPELVVDNSSVATPAGIQHRGAENQAAAAKFYGVFYNKDNAGELNEAHFWLISAIKADEEGAESKFYMTLANSLKYEQYAFGNRTATSTVLIGKLKGEGLFSNRTTPRPSQAKAA